MISLKKEVAHFRVPPPKSKDMRQLKNHANH